MSDCVDVLCAAEMGFRVSPPLRPEHAAYLHAFFQSHRVARNVVELIGAPDREAAGLPLGHEGEFFLGATTLGILDPVRPPHTQPDLRCDWAEDGEMIWTSTESHAQWIEYVRERLLTPWGYALLGDVVGPDCATIPANWSAVRSRYWPSPLSLSPWSLPLAARMQLFRRHVKAWMVVSYWLQATGRRACAPGGAARKRHREEYEGEAFFCSNS